MDASEKLIQAWMEHLVRCMPCVRALDRDVWGCDQGKQLLIAMVKGQLIHDGDLTSDLLKRSDQYMSILMRVMSERTH